MYFQEAWMGYCDLMVKRLYVIRLYVAGNKGRSLGVVENLKKLLDKEMPGQYSLKVVDVSRNPALAREHDLLALPAIIRTLPTPIQKYVGNLSDERGVAVGFNLATDKPRTVKNVKTVRR
jgi:circadian clock protein KaiB